MNTALKSLSATLFALKDKKELQDFLLGLLTPNEIQEFSQRIEIVKMLKKNIPQHQIAKTLGVGVATITRGSKEIKQGRFTQI